MVKLRTMKVEDINIVEHYEQMLFGHSLGYDMLYKELTDNPMAYYFILEYNNELAGYCGTWFTDPNSQIINIFIVPEYQGKKLGSLLLTNIIEFLKAKGAELITLEVRRSNEKAQNLYSKHGFEKAYVRRNYYSDGEDAIMMIKYL